MTTPKDSLAVAELITKLQTMNQQMPVCIREWGEDGLSWRSTISVSEQPGWVIVESDLRINDPW